MKTNLQSLLGTVMNIGFDKRDNAADWFEAKCFPANWHFVTWYGRLFHVIIFLPAVFMYAVLNAILNALILLASLCLLIGGLPIIAIATLCLYVVKGTPAPPPAK